MPNYGILNRLSNIAKRIRHYLSRLIQLKKKISLDIGDNVKHDKLWTISLIKPKSQRFSQVSFEGFNNSFFKSFRNLLLFIPIYINKKLKKILHLLQDMGALTLKQISKTKNLLVRKLIWSRGKLGRPIANAFIMTVALIVFMFGEVFNSSRLVNSQELEPGFLASTNDIIPNKNTAITTIPESRKQSEPFQYVIKEGDSLSSIGNQFKISVDALKYVNGLTDSTVLKIGQELTIPPVSGLVHVVEKGDSLASIAKKYDVPPQAVADFNYILDTSTIAVGTELIIPGAKIPEQIILPPISTAFVPPSAVVDPNASSGWCMWPTTTRIITQYFSWYHNGLDIATPHGVNMPPLYSCSSGTVIRSGWDPFGLGLHVAIDHGDGYETVYGHMSRIDVSYGQSVSKGETIGLMGNTGRSTGPHVHFIIKFNGIAQDPLNYIN